MKKTTMDDIVRGLLSAATDYYETRNCYGYQYFPHSGTLPCVEMYQYASSLRRVIAERYIT